MGAGNTPDLVSLSGCHALVLAGPGCGKTHLLTQRIIHANAVDGVPFADMICLTFTNRAAREMTSRIRAELGRTPDNLFVGNLHRFCSRLLDDNNLLPPGTSLLDEDDRDAWLAEALGARRKFERKQITDMAMLLFQQEHDFPQPLRRRLDFVPSQTVINAAQAYRDYKSEHRLVDFDDLLLLAYMHLSRSPINSLTGSNYRWLQVDEVQDLTPLQLAIIDLITADGSSTVIYLGDEQQAIFEFIGAGGPALDRLKQRCASRTYRLGRNYRAPAYLVDLCNRYAVANLGLKSDSLPTAADNSDRPADAMQLHYAADHNLPDAVSARIRSWLNEHPDERIAVLTRTNDEAENLSDILSLRGINHTLVGRNDLFRRPSYKTVCAHLTALLHQAPSAEWAQIFYRSHAARTLAEARGLTRRLKQLAISPIDLLSDSGLPAVCRMLSAFTHGDTVIFDTETTGLDVNTDDIIQIAARRYRCGQPVDDGGFSIIIRTGRPIPAMLADGTPNPMPRLYRESTPADPTEALAAFTAYVGDATLCAHNAPFDLAILRENCRRNNVTLPSSLTAGNTVDTLLCSRLLFPDLPSYTLASLINSLKLDGRNSHCADDDVAATALLLKKLCDKASETADSRREFLSSPAVRHVAGKFAAAYAPLYRSSLAMLSSADATIADIIDHSYRYLTEHGFISPVDRWLAVTAFFRDAYAPDSMPLRNRLASRLSELRTFNEGDLLDRERVTVITVHKAKGLEFDNIIVYNTAFRNLPHSSDDARVHYVALSRARRRIALFTVGNPSPHILSIAQLLSSVSPDAVEASALIERLHRPKSHQKV